MSKTIYTHKHHIIPKHMGGSDDPSNLIELTTEQHALAHKKLYEEHGNMLDKVAWLALSGQIGKEEAMRMVRSGGQKGVLNHRYGKPAPNRGKKHTEEAKRKMSEAAKGKILSEETKRKMSESSKGMKHTEEVKKKMSEALKRYNRTEEHNKNLRESIRKRKKIICICCGRKMFKANAIQHGHIIGE